jgi:hypothetical protein
MIIKIFKKKKKGKKRKTTTRRWQITNIKVDKLIVKDNGTTIKTVSW